MGGTNSDVINQQPTSPTSNTPSMGMNSNVINHRSTSPTSNAPAPPCYVPWVGKKFEAPCTTTVYTNNSITIKQYGILSNEILIESVVSGDVTVYQEAINLGAYEIFTYLSGDNNQKLNIEKARTVPLILRKPNIGTKHNWLLNMMIATSQYPNTTSIPIPTIYNTTLQLFHEHLFAVNYKHSTESPQPSDLDTLCQELMKNIPSTYTILPSNETAWSNAHIYYNTRDSTGPYDYECWMEVKPK